ncbi:MAG TPA: CPBP family intramembrane metalloprotease [Phycisphaerae bacterium]|nr:CPBP family intramembrane metalloprotease [Phycisphaerae bacterium]HPC21379.1 CPBP family intramembrane metalloprotease [Phycisphaerae bacterium]HRS28453.1 CPBP family intramembrane metalloprotease [Phycisphaerae bacterium]HRT41843.1 CPBP family intramembrane metalloprotease [Phycisphaerae bacterium]
MPSRKAALPARATRLSRLAAAWRLLVLVIALGAFYRAGPALCAWWFAPHQPDRFDQTAFYFSLLLVLAALLTLGLERLRDLPSLFRSRDKLPAQLIWAISAVACIYAFDVLVAVPYWLWFRPTGEVGSPTAKTLFAAATQNRAALVLLVTAIGAAAEELFFRGLLLRYLTDLFRAPKLAILTSAAFFGLAHLGAGYFNALIALWMGIVLGAIYARRGGLLTVVAAHFLFNASNLLLVPAIWHAE